MFPRLGEDELERLARFGEHCSYRAGDAIAKVGDVGRGLLLVTSGKVEVTRHDRGHNTYIITHERGNFLGELAQLSGRPYLVDAVAVTHVEAVAVAPQRLGALVVPEAGLGGPIMRALDLPRGGLIVDGGRPLHLRGGGHARL